MKKLLKQALAACAAVLLSAGISQAADYNLKLQTYYPATTLQIAQGFADNVKAMSNGRVDIQIFSGGELVGSGNILKSVKSGNENRHVGIRTSDGLDGRHGSANPL